MSLDKIVVTLIGLAGTVFTYWFFLGKKEKQIVVGKEIDIVVDGGYSPETIIVKKNQVTKLNFIRKDSNSCLEEVNLGDFKIRKYLPLNQKITIEIKPNKTGEFTYSCGMNMFHGKIIVEIR